jgi:hypothetical protein
MITLLRRQAHVLRAVLRRSVLGITHRGPVAPIVFTAADGQLCARHRHPYQAIEHATRVAWPSSGSAALPLDALAEVEGRDDSILALDPVAPDRTVVRWSDRGIPKVHEYTVPAIEDIGKFPCVPNTWSEVPADLITALADATASSADDDTRYALSCLQLKAGSKSHEVIATDGRQILIRGGFLFPWTGDVLVRRSPLFASRELPHDRPWRIGRTDTHVGLRCDPWTILLEIQGTARFPRVDMIFPTPDAATARLRLDPADASFLTDTLGRLPGSEIHNAPVTVDLNGRIAIRARGSESETTTELILSRSSYGGSPVRFQSNRDFLTRAIRLGFREIEIVDPTSPIVCRAGDRAYAWQPLDAESAIAPTEDATRIESHLHPSPTRSSQPMNERIKTEEATTLVREVTPAHPEVNHDVAATGLIALIREAESLHEALGEARARSQKLVVALRRQRKQARLMNATLNTLRQLKLQEVAG